MIFELLRNPGPQDMKSSGEAFAYFEYGMTVVGWLPPSKGQKLYMMFRGFVILLWIIYLPFGIITDVINIVGCSLKVTNFYIYLSQYDKAKKLMNRMDEFCADEADRCSIRYWVARCNLIFIIYSILYHSYGGIMFLNLALIEVLPYPDYNPFINWRTSTTNFWIVFFLQCIILSFELEQQMMVDVFNINYCLMLRAHLQILRQRVRKLHTDPEEGEKESYKELLKCITHHKLIFKYADLMRSLFSINTFIQFVLIGTMLGCTLVTLLFFSDFWNGLSRVVLIIALIAQTFPFCYTCDLIIDDCDRLELAIFHSNWVGSSRRYKSTIIQFLHYAQQPIGFTAGSIFPICMQTNIQVAKLAFSVVTFMRQLNVVEKWMTN